MELETFINQEKGNDANRLLALGFLSFFKKNGFAKSGVFYKHEDLINVTIANSTVLNEIQFTIGFKNSNGSFFGMSRNIRTVEDLQEVLVVLCGFETYR
jgi:hypothetical protein